MSKIKKLIVGVSALVIGAACSASVAAGWEIKGYDTSALIMESFNKYNVNIVYELYDENGLSTGVVVSGNQAALYGLKPFAEVSFSEPAFELAWPNREYIAVYADGVDTGKLLYNGVSENLQYRNPNFMWELAAPHRIYRRTQALINGEWYTDTSYPVTYAGDVATVMAEYKNYYGFGDWRIEDSDNDGFADGVMYWTPDAIDGNPNLVPYMNTDDNIYYTILGETKIAEDALDPGAVTDLTWASDVQIKKAFSLVVSGPQFNYDGSLTPGNEFAMAYSAADIEDADLLHNFAVEQLVKNIYSHDGSESLANVEWVDAGFEMAVPYRYYQILMVDGVLLDGSSVKGTKLPYVYRYIIDADGNYATANLTSTWDTELSGYQWNETVGKYEFLVDVIETISVPNGGPVIAVNRTPNQPSNVFGQLNFSESFVGGTKVITATLEGIALNGEIYSMKFTGSTMDDINWGAPIFNEVKAELDPEVENALDIVVFG